MPPEPKKPIEKLLEASAQLRRAEFGGDPKMPNPMRTRLQDEIARLARGVEPAPRSRWFAISWPRLAMGAAFASLALGAVTLWWQTHQGPTAVARYATQDRLEAGARPAAPSSQPIPAPAEADKLADTAEASAKGNLAESAPNDSADSKASLARAASENQRSLQDFSQAAPRPAGAAAGSVAASKEAAVANLKQQFSQSAANKAIGRSAGLQQAPKILDNFQVEQNGRDFRVVDADGSTYTGQIERLTRDDTRNLAKQKQSYAAPATEVETAPQGDASPASPNDEFYFRASGYNDSLKKALVFEGNYIVDASRAKKDLNSAAQQSDAQLAARIVGTAKVSGEPPVQVDAIAVPSK